MSASSKSHLARTIRILGIDPGSRLTGYGIIDVLGSKLQVVTHGTLKLSSTSGKQDIALETRLHSIYLGLTSLIEKHRPHVMSVERVFFAKNAVSALKLGQARGAAILTGAIHGLEIAEYSPSEVKSTVVGHGQADKDQVARMIQILLANGYVRASANKGRAELEEFETSDASDALALAICHAQMVSSRMPITPTDLKDAARQQKTSHPQGSAAQRYADIFRDAEKGKSKRKSVSLAEAVGIRLNHARISKR